MSRKFKNIWGIFLLALLPSLSLYAQNATLSIQNLQLMDTIITGDIYLKRTGTQNIYLTDCTIYIEIDSTKFSTPTFAFTSFLPSQYSSNTHVYTTLQNLPWILAIDISFLPGYPSTTNTVNISSAGNGTKLGTFQLTGLSRFTGTLTPVWRTVSPLRTVFFSYNPQINSIVQVQYSTVPIPTLHLGPYFTLILKGQQLLGTTATATLAIQRTGGTSPFYLDTLTVKLLVDSTAISPSSLITVQQIYTERLSNYYTVTATRSGDTVILQFAPPQVQSSSEFLQKIQSVPDTAMPVAKFSLSSIRRGISIFDIDFHFDSLASQKIKRRRYSSPWNRSDDITANGDLETEQSTVAVQVLSHQFSDTLCAGKPDTIRWNVQNANAIQIILKEVPPGTESQVIADTAFSELQFIVWTPQAANAGKQWYYKIRTLGSHSEQDSTMHFIIGSAPTILSQPNTAYVRIGDTATFTVTISGNPQPSIQWEVSPNGLYWGALQGETRDTLRIRGVQIHQDSLYFRAKVMNQCDTLFSEQVQLIIIQPLTIVSEPVSVAICEGSSAAFRVRVTGTEPQFQWQWRQSSQSQWEDIPGANDSSYSIPLVTAQQNLQQYRVRIWNNYGDTVFSAPAILRVYTPPTFLTMIPDTLTACAGESVSLSYTLSGDPSPLLLWEYSDDNGQSWHTTNISTATLTIAPLRINIHNRLYRLKAANICDTLISAPTRILVHTAPAVTEQPKQRSTCPGTSVTFFTAAQGFPEPQVYWQKKAPNADIWETITGANGRAYTVHEVIPEMNQTAYRAIFQNPCGMDTTQPAILTIYTPPKILKDPQDTQVCLGDTATFAIDVIADPPPQFQWEIRLPGWSQWSKIPGSNTAELRYPATSLDLHNAQFRVKISHPCDTVISSTATLSLLKNPSILVQPTSVITYAGKPVSFHVRADTFARHYQWYRDGIALTDAGRYSGSTTSTFHISAVHPSDVSNNYYCIVSGDCGTDTSRRVSLTLIIPDVEILQHPEDLSLCEGNIASFTVVAEAIGEGTTLQYQWRRGSTPLVEGSKYAGTTTPTLTIFNVTPADAATNYNVLIQALPSGRVTASKNAALFVSSPPIIQRVSPSVELCESESVTLEVTASGTPPLQYQWYHNGIPLEGASQSRLNLFDLSPSDSGIYTCQVQNTCGNAFSPPIQVAVSTQPVLLSQPVDTLVLEGDTLEITLKASGTEPIWFHWYKNDQPFISTPSPTLRFSPISRSDEGSYFCIIENSCGIDRTITFSIAVSVVAITPFLHEQQSIIQLTIDGSITALPSQRNLYPIQIQLFNAAGVMLFHSELKHPYQKIPLPLQQLAHGVYFLRCHTHTGKIITIPYIHLR